MQIYLPPLRGSICIAIPIGGFTPACGLDTPSGLPFSPHFTGGVPLLVIFHPFGVWVTHIRSDQRQVIYCIKVPKGR